MPLKASNKKIERKLSKKRKVKVQKPRIEELNEEVNTFLTTYNPYLSQSCVEFDQESKEFKQIYDYKKPIIYFRNVGSTKQKITEVVPEDTIVKEKIEDRDAVLKRNEFNLKSIGTQTPLINLKNKKEYTDPTLYPVLSFQGNASKTEILEAYKEHEKKNEDTKMKYKNGWFKGDLKFLLRHTGRRALTDVNRKTLRLCERMIDQNLRDANMDFMYYDNPHDEFRPNAGSLLPLWKMSCKKSKKMHVTSISWNVFYQDLFAVGYRMREKTDDEHPDEDDIGLIFEQGCVCVFSLKGPSYPEKILVCPLGVICVSFHPHLNHLLAVAFAGGTVSVYDLRRKENSPKRLGSNFQGWFHQDRVSEVQWFSNGTLQKFSSISNDGKIINWSFLQNDLFSTEVVTQLRVKDWPIEAPPKGLEMNLEPQEDSLLLNTCGTTISLNAQNEELFLVGTETGLIYKCSFDDKKCVSTYEEHKGNIHRVHWNYLHPLVFISCSKDFTIQVWDHTYEQPVFEFFFEREVKDVAWAPFSSTLFAAISGKSMVNVFDLAVDKQGPLGTYTVYTPKQNISLTRVIFHLTKPIVIVGDDRGCVVILKLSPNLRSSLKAMGTLEKYKFISREGEKMNKLLANAKVKKHD